MTYYGPGQLVGYPIRMVPAKRGGGMTDTVVSIPLGHSSITTTLDRYGHLFKDEHEKLAQRVDDAYHDVMAGNRSAASNARRRSKDGTS